jgi:aspartokinase-like uncharacterized kinase
MTARGVRVIKVGGSLFDYAGFLPAWKRWSAEQPPAAQVLIAGGGKLADAIREADTAKVSMHNQWAVSSPSPQTVSARLLAAILKECRLESSWQRLRQQLDERQVDVPLVFCPVEFLQQVEQRLAPQPLPHGWSVTSDSIAARIAGILDADELVLLKSADPPAYAPPRPPYVDEYFAQAARGLNGVRYVNLRRYA